MEQFAKTGDFCPNEACPDYGKLQNDQQQNIIRFGKTRKGVQRYRCKTCEKTFTETTGTLFFRKRTPEHEILETLALLAEGNTSVPCRESKDSKKTRFWPGCEKPLSTPKWWKKS